MDVNSVLLDRQKPIIVAAGGRSGSTWVLDALARANLLRTIFEPFNPEAVAGARRFAYKYVRDDDENANLKFFLDKIIWKQDSRLWTKYRISKKHFFWHKWSVFSSTEKAKFQLTLYREVLERYFRYKGQSDLQRPIVKFIRANLMLGWLKKKYSPHILLLFRHPGAVVESKMRLSFGGWGYNELWAYMQDQKLKEDYLQGITFQSVDKMSKAEGFATAWCIETLVALDKARTYSLPVVFYENLVMNPDSEWLRIVRELGLENIPSGEWLSEPSVQTSPHHKKNVFNQNGLHKWMDRMSETDKLAIGRVLNRFGISLYRMSSPFPEPHLSGIFS